MVFNGRPLKGLPIAHQHFQSPRASGRPLNAHTSLQVTSSNTTTKLSDTVYVYDVISILERSLAYSHDHFYQNNGDLQGQVCLLFTSLLQSFSSLMSRGPKRPSRYIFSLLVQSIKMKIILSVVVSCCCFRLQSMFI